MTAVEKVDWFCPKCNSYVSSESVTFEETHQICNTGVILEPLNQNKMRVFYVIKNFISKKYISVNEEWDEWDMCKEFQTKEEAEDYGFENSLGLCVIEEVIDF